jgi:hypothetical protein
MIRFALKPSVARQAIAKQSSRGELIGRPPGQNLTGRPVHIPHQIQKAVLDGDVGDVAAPTARQGHAKHHPERRT